MNHPSRLVQTSAMIASLKEKGTKMMILTSFHKILTRIKFRIPNLTMKKKRSI